MPKPRFQRRKEDRPAELTNAALVEFSRNGYAGTRVDDVAKRAGVSKGLLYLYFKTKEDLFKAVVRSFVVPKITELSALVAQPGVGAEEFLRGPFLAFIKSLPESRARVVVRLMIAEGHKYPDLTRFYWENVVSKGLGALRKVVERGVANGEFRKTALLDFPHLFVAPVVFSLLWRILFAREQALDTGRLLETHVEILLHYLGAGPGREADT
jgi:AcrR family transcriptional regulator